MSKRDDTDWDLIEAEYRAGVKTVRQIAENQPVSHQAISKRAKSRGWTQDLAAKIAAKRAAKVARAAVADSVDQLATNAEIVEAEAEIQSRIALAHRKDVPRKRELAAKLFAEIEGMTDNVDLIKQLTLALQSGDQDKLADVARRVASLPSRIKGFGELVTAYKSLIGLERQAFGLDDVVGNSDDPLSTFFRDVMARTKPLVPAE